MWRALFLSFQFFYKIVNSSFVQMETMFVNSISICVLNYKTTTNKKATIQVYLIYMNKYSCFSLLLPL